MPFEFQVSGTSGSRPEPEPPVQGQGGIAVPDAQSQGHACGFGFGDQRPQHGRCNPLALQFGNDRNIDDPKLACFAIQQKPSRGLSAKFNNKILRVREARSIVAALRLILEAHQGLALWLRQGSEFGFPGGTKQSEQKGFVFGAYLAEMDHFGSEYFSSPILSQCEMRCPSSWSRPMCCTETSLQ